MKKLIPLCVLLILLGTGSILLHQMTFSEPEQPLVETYDASSLKQEPWDIWRYFKAYQYGPDRKNILYLAVPKQTIHSKSVSPKLALLVHGGNYLSGSAEGWDMAILAKPFLQKGYVVASLDYRDLSTDIWPLPVKDVIQGIVHVQKLLAQSPPITETVYVGFSAGAVTGALLLYSEQFQDIPRIDKFIGISGLYSKKATALRPVEEIRQLSVNQFNILDAVQEIGKPKTLTPALLIEGTEDYFVDRFPNTADSHAEYLKARLKQHHLSAESYWVDTPGYKDHVGPLHLMAQGDTALLKKLNAFLD